MTNAAKRARKKTAKTTRQTATDEKTVSFPIVVRITSHQANNEDWREQAEEELRKRLETVQRLAGLQFGPADIAIVAQCDPSAMTGGIREMTLAYDSGRLLAEARVRTMLLAQAEAGSSPAQKKILELAEENKRKAADANAANPLTAELAAVRQHLLGIGLVKSDSTPTQELARLAVQEILQLRGKGFGEKHAK
jgi:hypothetical protein